MKTFSNSASFRAADFKSASHILMLFMVMALCSGPALAQTLTNGGNHDGTIAVNGTNTYTFSANTGDSIVLRCGELSGTASFAPWIQLYGPTSALLASDFNASDAFLTYRATNSGTFTVTVSATISSQTGTYRLRFMKIPGTFIVPSGDEGGPLTNGGNHDGTNDLGDEDIWTFTANAKDNIVLRCGQLSGAGPNGYYPRMNLYGPNGALLAADFDASDAYIAYQTTNAGTFTVLVGSAYQGDTGSYRLRFMKIPGTFIVPSGDEGGPLTNGGNHDGTNDLGDEDIWTFTANAKDNVVLRCGQLSGAGPNGYYPYLRLYGPNGALLASDFNTSDSYIAYQTTNAGTFSVLVGSAYQGDTGSYRLRFMQVPGAFIVPSGDEGGPLTNGGNHDGTNDLGDEDIWTFTANAKDNIVLRCGQLSGAGPNGFYPRIKLFGPNGALLASDFNPSDAYIAYQTTNSGTFTVLIDSTYPGDTGSYRLRFMQMPGTFIVPSGDEGGSLTNGANHDGAITVGDEDPWRFTACKGEQIVLTCAELTGTTSFYPWIQLFGPNGAHLAEAVDPTVATLTYQTTNRGTFTVIVSSYYQGETGTYRLTSNGLSDGLKLCIATISGTNVNFTGVGGSDTFVLYTATNVATPSALWAPIITNHFDASGAFVGTNLFNRMEFQRYFRLYQP